LFAAMAAMLASIPFVWIWYDAREQTTQFAGWDFDWSKISSPVEFEPINPRIEEVLHYSEGELGAWKGPGKLSWMAYFLRWDDARAAQLGGIHRPEACLPAVGWNLVRQDDNFHWSGPDGLDLVFNTYEFQGENTRIYVFYCQWDQTNYPFYDKTGRNESD